jgi:uncharacterized integral membrane protein
MYISVIIALLLLLGLIISSLQNTITVELNCIFWRLQMSIAAIILWSSIFGGTIVAVVTLPKVVSTYLKVKTLNKQLSRLKNPH